MMVLTVLLARDATSGSIVSAWASPKQRQRKTTSTLSARIVYRRKRTQRNRKSRLSSELARPHRQLLPVQHFQPHSHRPRRNLSTSRFPDKASVSLLVTALPSTAFRHNPHRLHHLRPAHRTIHNLSKTIDPTSQAQEPLSVDILNRLLHNRAHPQLLVSSHLHARRVMLIKHDGCSPIKST